MNIPTPLIRDVLPLLREQLSTELVDELFLLAVDDPATFALEMLATAKSGRVDLPAAVLDALEHEVSRMDGAAHADSVTTSPAGTDLDPLVRRQRRIDAVARQVRERRDRSDRNDTVPAPRTARPAAGFNKAGLDPG